MSTSVISSNKSVDVNVYWNLLKDLSMDVKLDLIARLSKSLLNKGKTTDESHWISDFAGKWKDNRSAEEIINDIRESRTTNRGIEL